MTFSIKLTYHKTINDNGWKGWLIQYLGLIRLMEKQSIVDLRLLIINHLGDGEFMFQLESSSQRSALVQV